MEVGTGFSARRSCQVILDDWLRWPLVVLQNVANVQADVQFGGMDLSVICAWVSQTSPSISWRAI